MLPRPFSEPKDENFKDLSIVRGYLDNVVHLLTMEDHL